MDKPGNHKTITIKINGKDRLIEKDPKNNSSEEQEKIINLRDYEQLSSRETAAAQEVEEEDEFDWILPEIDDDEIDLQEYKIVNKKKPGKGKSYKSLKAPSKKMKNKGILPSILLTVFLAVILGTSLGILMLKMVISDSAMETGVTPTEVVPTAEDPKSTTGSASVETTPITGYVIQGGAFSNVEAAGVEATGMTDKGVPAKVIELDGKAFLFVGIADTLPNAKSIGEQLKGKGIETFAKEVQFGGSNVTELSDNEKLFLEAFPSLYNTLSELAAIAQLNNSITSEQLTSINSQLEKFNGKGIEQEKVEELRDEMVGGVAELKSFSENKDSSSLVKVQQHILNLVAIYHTF